MRFLLLLISLLASPSSFLYWEDMTENQQQKILNSSELPSIVKEFVNSPWKVSDDEKSLSLLTELTSDCKGPEIRALFFYQFNSILTKTDGALRVVTPNYVMSLVEKHPEYVFKYLQSHDELYDCYILELAFYFSFNTDTSIEDCEEIMKQRCPQSMTSWISSFFEGIHWQRDFLFNPFQPLIDPVESKPTFGDGDMNDFAKWVYEHLNYPEEAKKDGVQGRVIVSFTISEEGKLTKVKVLKNLHPLLDQEAVRVIQSAPDIWKPGSMHDRGKTVPVAVKYTFPVRFKLPEE